MNKLAQLPARMIRRMWQGSLMAFVIVLLGAGVLGRDIIYGEQIVGSLVLGILLWLLPNCYFAIKTMRCLGKVPPSCLLNIFYRAELIKLLLSGLFFIMVIRLISVNIPILLSGYLAVQLIFWLLLIIKSKEGLL